MIIQAELNKAVTERRLGLYHQVSKVLTNAQILTLPTTPLELVPAQASKIFIPIFGVGILDATGGVYGNVSPTGATGSNGFLLSNDGAVTLPVDWSFLLEDDSAIGIFYISGPFLNSYNDDPIDFIKTSGGYLSDSAGSALMLGAVNTLGDFTDGHDDNTLKLTVAYLVYDVINNRFQMSELDL